MRIVATLRPGRYRPIKQHDKPCLDRIEPVSLFLGEGCLFISCSVDLCTCSGSQSSSWTRGRSWGSYSLMTSDYVASSALADVPWVGTQDQLDISRGQLERGNKFGRVAD